MRSKRRLRARALSDKTDHLSGGYVVPGLDLHVSAQTRIDGFQFALMTDHDRRPHQWIV